jgi:hypothetical protein
MTPSNNSPKLIGSRENPLQAIGSFIVKIAKTIGRKNLAIAKVLAMKVAQNAENLVAHSTTKNIQNGPLTNRGT